MPHSFLWCPPQRDEWGTRSHALAVVGFPAGGANGRFVALRIRKERSSGSLVSYPAGVNERILKATLPNTECLNEVM